MDIDKTMHFFSLFTDLTEEAAEQWRELCRMAQSRLEKRLRPEAAQPPDSIDMERLCIAAGAWAYCDYAVITAGTGSGDTVRVGDISLKAEGAALPREVADIRDYFLEQAADLLAPGFSVLTGVEA